jgi:hypothetical protein
MSKDSENELNILMDFLKWLNKNRNFICYESKGVYPSYWPYNDQGKVINNYLYYKSDLEKIAGIA